MRTYLSSGLQSLKVYTYRTQTDKLDGVLTIGTIELKVFSSLKTHLADLWMIGLPTLSIKNYCVCSDKEAYSSRLTFSPELALPHLLIMFIEVSLLAFNPNTQIGNLGWLLMYKSSLLIGPYFIWPILFVVRAFAKYLVTRSRRKKFFLISFIR